MPGKKSGPNGGWEYITRLQLLRKVSTAEIPNNTVINAVEEVIDLSKQESVDDRINRGVDNRLCLGVLLPDNNDVTSATIQVFVDMSTEDVSATARRWAFVKEETVTVSTHFCDSDVYPGAVKVLLTAISGTGDVEIVYGRTE